LAPAHERGGELLFEGGDLGSLRNHPGGENAVHRLPLLGADDRLRRGDEVQFRAHAVGPSWSSGVSGSSRGAGRGASASGEEASRSPPVESSGTYHSPVAGHTHASVPSEAGTSFCPERPTQARRRA